MRFASRPRAPRAPSLLLAVAAAAAPAHAAAPAANSAAPPAVAQAVLPARTVTMSVGSGQLVRLARPMTGLFVADEKIADVQVRSPNELFLFGKAPGQTSIYATDRAGAVVWSSEVRVGNNITNVGAMLKLAMPEANITVTPIGGMVLLTGTVDSPKDIEEAQRLAETFIGSATQVLNHLRTAIPLQVSLHVKIVEVSRSVAKNIGVNLLNQNLKGANPITFASQGTPGTLTKDPATGQAIATFQQLAGTTLGIAGHIFGGDIMASLQLDEQNGLVTTLAEPNLTAVSGETASFLAGGEIPVPQSQGLGAVSVEFKQYGVSLAFTPFVLSDGRISLRVRPEVSQLSAQGSVTLNGFTIPALTTRRADTTVELGSGQSFVIGGLLQSGHNNSISRAPFLGDLPILGALFRSNSFQNNETELVIVVTPYLVRPVDAKQIVLPTDGYRSPDTAARVLRGKLYDGTSGARSPAPVAATPIPTPPSRP